MNASQLIEICKAKDILLSIEGDDLAVEAEDGALDEELINQLKTAKPQIIELLVLREQAIRTIPSRAQQRLYYLEEMMGRPTSTYNLPAIFKVHAELDHDRCQRIAEDILRQQSILRAHFEYGDELQLSYKSFEETISESCIHWHESNVTKHDLVMFADLPFDINGHSLFRIGFFKIEQQWFVAFIAHHALLDGDSINQFGDYFFQRYFGTSAATDYAVRPYQDYVAYQAKRYTESEKNRLSAVWKNYLSGSDPIVHFAREENLDLSENTGERVRCFVDIGSLDAFKSVLKEENCSLFLGLLTVYAQALCRLTFQSELVIGIPVSEKERLGFKDTLGLFVNTIPLRISIDPFASFKNTLDIVKKSYLQVIDYQDSPFDIIVESVSPSRSNARSPLYQTMISYLDESNDSSLPNIEKVYLDTSSARLELTLFIEDQDDQLNLCLEFDDCFIEKATAELVLSNFKSIVCSITSGTVAQLILSKPLPEDSPDRPLSQSARLGPVVQLEHQHIWDQLLSIQGPAGSVYFSKERISWVEILSLSERMARNLVSEGVGANTLVALFLNRSIDFLAAALAIWRVGATYLPLDPNYPSARLQYILDDSAAQYIIASDESHIRDTQLNLSHCRAMTINTIKSELSQIDLPLVFDAEAIAYVIYTSGSTGQPKGVAIYHRSLANFLSSMADKPGLNAADHLLSITTISFDISLLELFLPLWVGCDLTIATAEQTQDIVQICELIENRGINTMQATPSTWRLLQQLDWRPSRNFKALSGGEALPREVAEYLLTRTSELWNLYGPTEATIWASCERIIDADRIRIGTPLQNTGCLILDKESQLAPVNVEGELCLSGTQLAKGYWNKISETEKRFSEIDLLDDIGTRIYRTGDLARYRYDGSLEYLGRIDQQVKVRGFRIELGEIEYQLVQIPHIKEAAVAVKVTSEDDVRLVAFIVTENQDCDLPSLREKLREFLPEYMLPQRFEMVATLPKTENGKLDRNELNRILIHDEIVSNEKQVIALETPTENQIAAIWNSLIGPVSIGRYDNFFEIGGHSLLAIRARMRIEEATGVKVEMRFLVLSSLFEIAEYCTKNQLNSENSSWVQNQFRNLLKRK